MRGVIGTTSRLLLMGVVWLGCSNRSALDVTPDSSVVLQRTSTDCGLAALATLASQIGRSVDFDLLSAEVQVSEHGLSLLEIQQIAAARNIALRGVFVSGGTTGLPTPWIAHWRSELGHYVVVESVGKYSVTIADPATGRRTMSLSEFLRRWSGNALALDLGH